MKMHINFATRDIIASVAFYGTLLSAKPTKNYADYALFVVDEPLLELALELDPHADIAEGAHYGVTVESADKVDAAVARLQSAGYAVDIEKDATCCYAVQNKVWATDPDGRRWEIYQVITEVEERDEAPACCLPDHNAGAARGTSDLNAAELVRGG